MGDIFIGSMMAARHATVQAERIKHVNQATNLMKTEVSDLKDQVERLSLLNQALWELVRNQLKLTDADLEQKAQEVDLRDGIPDGKMTSHPLRCPTCGRVSNSKHRKCLYCGLEFQGDIFG